MATLYQELDKGTVHPVYVLHGAEHLLIREAQTRITEAALGGGPKDFNETRLLWKETTAGDVVGACRTYPMMGPRRVVVVSGIDALKGDESKILAEYLAEPVDTATLVLVGTKLDARTKWVKAARKSGRVDKFDAPYQNKIPQWILERARDKKITIDRDAAHLLGDVVGNRLAALDESLDRLILYVATEPGAPIRIRLGDVEQCIARTRVHSVFELADALGARRADQALQILEAMLEAREPPIAILSMVHRHLRRLWEVSDRLGSAPPDVVGRDMGVPDWLFRKLTGQARLFTHPEYAGLIDRIFETDRLLKSSRMPPAMHLHALVLDFCARR